MILNWIDRIAGIWLNMRVSWAARKAGMADITLEEMHADKNGLLIIMRHDSLAFFASEAAALLNEFNASNYVQIEMMPRVDHAKRPVLLTVQWKDGESPSAKATRLEKRVKELEGMLEIAGAA